MAVAVGNLQTRWGSGTHPDFAAVAVAAVAVAVAAVAVAGTEAAQSRHLGFVGFVGSVGSVGSASLGTPGTPGRSECPFVACRFRRMTYFFLLSTTQLCLMQTMNFML